MKYADVVIVGGGGVGSAIAYFLSLHGGVSVIACERDPTYAYSATALAAGGVRQQFSTPENVLMSQYGYEFLSGAAETLAVNGEAAAIGVKPEPYLRLVAAEQLEAVSAQVEMQRSLGATPSLLDRDALRARFPWMHTDDVGAGVLGGKFEGVFDSFGLLQALRKKSIAQGAAFIGAEVVEIVRTGGAIQSVRLADGSEIGCRYLIDAAGARAGVVARLAGVDLPVVPLKANNFAFRTPAQIGDCPIVLDQVGGLNFKPEGNMYIAAAPRDSAPPAFDDFDVDYATFEGYVWPALAHRVPEFSELRLQRGWVGHIEWCTFDANPILGAHPELSNFIMAAGFSGHGAQHIPAAGRAVAELILFGDYRSLDLKRFSYRRIAEQAPVCELV